MKTKKYYYEIKKYHLTETTNKVVSLNLLKIKAICKKTINLIYINSKNYCQTNSFLTN